MDIGANKKKYDGSYIGEVVSLYDPQNLMRVRVKINGMFDGEESSLPLATYLLPVGSRAGDGNFTPVKVGDHVWIDFPMNGDTRYPRITGSVHYCPGGVPNIPVESWNGTPATRSRESWEPAVSSGTYHEDVVETQHGITTTKRADGSISILQRGTGAEIYIHPDGQVVVHSPDKLSVSADGDIRVNSKGNVLVNSEGTATVSSLVSATVSAPSIILKNTGIALKKLLTTTFMTLFNGHTHPTNTDGNTSQPNQQAAVGTHTTSIVQAE